MRKLTLLVVLLASCMMSSGQEMEIESIPLPYSIGQGVNYTQSKMIMEDETIYVPTSDGIYSLDLKAIGKGWTSVGLEGEDLIECVHRGEEWLAITRNQNMRLLLRSTDNGKTVEDFTPYSLFPENKYRTVVRFCQDPVNPEIVYLLSGYVGILKSDDFGKTWSLLSEIVNCNPSYCGFEIHPLDTDILLQHGEMGSMRPAIMISHNGGVDWINSWGYPLSDIVLPTAPDYAEDCIHDMAFHPTDINTWVFGGEGVIAKTTDGGRTWFHKAESWGYQYSTLYDNHNPDVLYSLGTNNIEDGRKGWIFLVSTDGGETWKNTCHYSLDKPWYCDMKQTEDELIILGTENLYFVKKKDLMPSTGVHDVQTDDSISNAITIYSIDGSVVRLNADEKEIDRLPKGCYILRSPGRTVKIIR